MNDVCEIGAEEIVEDQPVATISSSIPIHNVQSSQPMCSQYKKALH